MQNIANENGEKKNRWIQQVKEQWLNNYQTESKHDRNGVQK